VWGWLPNKIVSIGFLRYDMPALLLVLNIKQRNHNVKPHIVLL